MAGKQLHIAKGLQAPFEQSFSDFLFVLSAQECFPFAQCPPAVAKHLTEVSFESIEAEGTG